MVQPTAGPDPAATPGFERIWHRIHPHQRDLIVGVVAGALAAPAAGWIVFHHLPAAAGWFGALLGLAYTLSYRQGFDLLPPAFRLSRRSASTPIVALVLTVVGGWVVDHFHLLDGLALPWGGESRRPGVRWLDWSRAVSPYLYVGAAVTLIGTWFEFYRFLGPDRMIGYLLGLYQKPRRVRRIFLFLDLDDATAHAERLGPERTFELLNDFYHAMTRPVEDAYGTIYQYVGDQVVAEWIWEEGVREGHVLRAVESCRRSLERRAPRWARRFGCRPSFKAGVHGGEVLQAEVGTTKREFTYSGDVLNATQRIQTSCASLGVRLLISAPVVEGLPAGDRRQLRSLGAVTLRGRREPIELFSSAAYEIQTRPAGEPAPALSQAGERRPGD